MIFLVGNPKQYSHRFKLSFIIVFKSKYFYLWP
jgi:hypothetical protein